MTQQQYKLCLSIATRAHEGQTRWHGEPYISHPIAVASQFKDYHKQSIALLHDVIEDTETTMEDLINKGVEEDIIKVVIVLTRQEDESYLQYILRISRDESASRVKLKDLEHNLSDILDGSMKDKYELARYVLLQSWATEEWAIQCCIMFKTARG